MGQNWVKWVLDIRCYKRKARSMKKIVKIVAVAIIILVITVVPVYCFTRPASAPAGVILTVTGKVYVPLSITWDDLNSLSPVAKQVNLSSTDSPNEHGVFSFTVVSLGQVLQNSKPYPYPNATTVTFTGSKGQSTTMTLQEINQNLETIAIALGKNGVLLSGSEGPLRLFIPTDTNTDRWIKGLYSIVVN
jgi:DMSO/TMAO reductase YedYZ molybdopterin-dependent catalytic subunit